MKNISNKPESRNYGNTLYEWDSKIGFLNAIVRNKNAILHDWGYILLLMQNDVCYSFNKIHFKMLVYIVLKLQEFLFIFSNIPETSPSMYT